ncbi:indolethylamine N-methyltransferase-like [Stegodyphus dumicola]|uniref:indolethylamine N-methyltransferase-like n=1 Tax=Stegodyphus dumicola TaxID=202533 RepID=UPI0015A830DD|nr:indolethylamine N-methyltransferase-like [Stegodyphus dumicola]
MDYVDENAKEVYTENFKGEEYNEELKDLLPSAERFFEFYLAFVQEVLKSKKFEGSKLLEIGSATTIHNIASASFYYENIVQSEFTKNSREILKRWHKSDINLDFSPLLNIIAKLEGYGSELEKGRNALESRIRKSVKCVVSCDLLSNEILKMEELISPETQPPYDLVITMFTLEPACPDSHHFLTALKGINKLLRKGGGLIAAGLENAGGWKVGEKWFPFLHHNVQDIVRALKEAGFGNITFKLHYPHECGIYQKHDSIYCFAAEKL